LQGKNFRILGCGHSESKDHFNNNALIQTSKHNVLIDCGHTIKHALFTQNMSFLDIDSVFITHVTGDHVFGLERLAYESKFKYNKRVTLYIDERIEEELWDKTPSGSLGADRGGVYCLRDWFDILFVKETLTISDDIHLRPVQVKHTSNKLTHGLLINEKVFYSSDTIAIPRIIEKIDFDVCFHDVTLSGWNPVHATLNSLIKGYPKAIRKKFS
jgi:phosphoribosyl 1,2-cyclic phosphodiesterase